MSIWHLRFQPKLSLGKTDLITQPVLRETKSQNKKTAAPLPWFSPLSERVRCSPRQSSQNPRYYFYHLLVHPLRLIFQQVLSFLSLNISLAYPLFSIAPAAPTFQTTGIPHLKCCNSLPGLPAFSILSLSPVCSSLWSQRDPSRAEGCATPLFSSFNSSSFLLGWNLHTDSAYLFVLFSTAVSSSPIPNLSLEVSLFFAQACFSLLLDV